MTSKEIINKSEKLKKSIIPKEKELKKLNDEIDSIKIEHNKKRIPLEKKIKKYRKLSDDYKMNNISGDRDSTNVFWGYFWRALLSLAIFFVSGIPTYQFSIFFNINPNNSKFKEEVDGYISLFLLLIIFILYNKIYYYLVGYFSGRKKRKSYKIYNHELGIINSKSEKTRLNLDDLDKVYNGKIYPLDDKIEELKKIINDLSIQIKNLNSINMYVVKYDKDDNELLDIAETTNIDKLLSKHQKNIREIEKAENTSFIPDLVKVNNYLNDYQNNLVEEFKILNSDYSVDTDVDSNTKKFTEDFEMYKVLISSLVLMIDSIVKDNHILYFKLKESMDKYGVFDSNFQKNQIALMKENNQVTSQLIKETKSSKDAIIKSLESVEGAVGGIQEELWDINMNLS